MTICACLTCRPIMPSDVKTTKGCQQRDTGADYEGSFLYAVWYSSKYLQKRERRAQPDELLSEIIRRIRSIEPMDAESMDAEPMEIVD